MINTMQRREDTADSPFRCIFGVTFDFLTCSALPIYYAR